MKVQINDTFPGASKGTTKEVDEWVGKELIRDGFATEVVEADEDEASDEKADKGAEGRKVKTDKTATANK